MESRRKTNGRFVALAAAWMLAAQGWALDGSEKEPILPATAAAAGINAWP
jgi:hypothetical protein